MTDNENLWTWTDGNHEDFKTFYSITEEYYSKIVGGIENRKTFIPWNLSESVRDVLLLYKDGKEIACAGLKPYSETAVEIKRVWVEPEYRGQGIASALMEKIEKKARLQGYHRVDNYPPYDHMPDAICFAKDL